MTAVSRSSANSSVLLLTKRHSGPWRPIPMKSAREQGTHLGEFLRRVMMNAAPLTRPEDIAWFLASYARDALATLEEKDGSTLAPLRTALETALGIKFEGEKGEHFFRSTLVQTLFYGVFSAWVIWAKGASSGKFDWKSAAYIMTVPMIRSLFEEVAKPSRLAPLGLMGILDRTGEALNRVDRTAFFQDLRHAARRSSTSMNPSSRPSIRNSARRWASGTRRAKSSATWSSGLILSCAPNWGSQTGLRTRTSTSSTPAAAQAPMWSRSCARSRRRCAPRVRMR